MNTVGPHIKITKPRSMDHSIFIVERQAIEKAIVCDISPDIEAPFKVGYWVAFNVGKAFTRNGEYFICIDFCVAYLAVS